MILFGTILAADEIEIGRKSAFLVELGELPILTRLAREMDKSLVKQWSIVLGSDQDIHRRAVENTPARIVINDDWHKGFIESAARGLHEMPPQANAFIVLPGNLPFFTSQDINEMASAMIDEKGFVIVAVCNNARFEYPMFHRKLLGKVRQAIIDGKFFDLLKELESETFEVFLDNPFATLQVRNLTDYEEAKKCYYTQVEKVDLSNPQSEIPQ
jgi:CTP:molybdopterin cytidylyltransferase MocA